MKTTLKGHRTNDRDDDRGRRHRDEAAAAGAQCADGADRRRDRSDPRLDDGDPGVHTLAIELHSSVGTIQWVTTGFLLAMAVAIPTTGWVEGRWGGKRAWIAALMVFVFGSVLCAVSWNDASLIAFRVVQGFGAGLIFPLMQTLAVRAAGGQRQQPADGDGQPADRPRPDPRSGARRGHPQLAELALAVPGQRAGDRRRAAARLALPATPTAPTSERPDPAPRLDVIGLALLGPALVGILLGLSQLSEDGGARPRRRAGAAAQRDRAAGRLHRLGVAARRAPADRRHPSAAPALARQRLRALFAAGAAIYAGMFLLPLYYQQLRGESVLHAGLLLIPQGVGALASRFVVGKLVDRLRGACRDDRQLRPRGPRHRPVCARRARREPVVVGRAAAGARPGDRGGADPADVGRLPGTSSPPASRTPP